MARRGGPAGKLLALGVGLLPFVLLESGLRLCGYGDDPFAAAEPVGPMYVRGGPLMVAAPEHERQLRVKAFPEETAPGTTRIIVVGDSGTYGYVPFGIETGAGAPRALPEPYPALLGKRLSARPGNGRFEVLNFGVCGYGTARLREVVEEAVRYRPDVLVFMAGSSDFPELRLFENWKRLEDARLGALYRLRMLTLARNLLWPRRRKAGDVPDSGSPWLPVLNTDVIRGPREREMLAERSASNLEEIVATCRKARVPLVLCTVPSHLRFGPRAFTDYPPELEEMLLGGLPSDDVAGFDEVLIRGRKLVDEGEHRAALDLVGVRRRPRRGRLRLARDEPLQRQRPPPLRRGGGPPRGRGESLRAGRPGRDSGQPAPLRPQPPERGRPCRGGGGDRAGPRLGRPPPRLTVNRSSTWRRSPSPGGSRPSASP